MSKHVSDSIKAVFFDHDDTLVGTIKPKFAEHKHIAKQYYAKELTDAEIQLHWGKPLHELVCLLYETNDAEQAMAYNKTHHTDYPKLLFAATIPTLQHLHAQGKLIGIVTATNRFSFEFDLKLHKVPRAIINYTQTADDTSYHKPDPRVFKPATDWLKKQKIKPGEVLYVGDGLHDMKAALGAGFNFLGVETGFVTAAQFKDAGARSISDISHLVR